MMPTLVLEPRDFGYSNYKNRSLVPETTVDLTGSTFLTQQLPDFRNAYPINLQGDAGSSLVGARVLGTTTPASASWGQRYNGGQNNSAGIVFTNTDDVTVERCRVHDVWDAVRFAGTARVKWTIRSCWISDSHDDAVENDSSDRRNGLIDDCLFDGFYVGISATSGKERGLIRMQNSLFYLKPLPGAHNEGAKLQPGHKNFFKVRNGDRVEMVGCILRADQESNSAVRTCHIPAENIDGQPQYELVAIDCIMVWTGKGDYPYNLAKGFTVTKDIKVWESAKQDWIDRHPDVPRFDFDPQPKKKPPPEPQGYRITQAPSSVMIDAHLGDYAEATPLYIETARAKMEARVMWSDAGLHFGIRVADDEVVSDTLSTTPWRQDSVEIFLDPTGDGGTAMSGNDLQLIITPQGRLWTSLPMEDAKISRAVALTPEGFLIEAMLPWPQEFNRKQCRLSFVLNDGHESVLLGGDRKQFKIPDKWMLARAV